MHEEEEHTEEDMDADAEDNGELDEGAEEEENFDDGEGEEGDMEVSKALPQGLLSDTELL